MIGLAGCIAFSLTFSPALIVQAEIPEDGQMLVTGKKITPKGTHLNVGSYPINMVSSQDGRFAIVSTIGFRQFLTVIRIADSTIVDQIEFSRPQKGLYYGLAVHGNQLVVSRGAEDRVTIYTIGGNGKLRQSSELHDPAPKGSQMPRHVCGVETDSSGSKLYIVNNQTTAGTNMQGALTIADAKTMSVLRRIPTPGFPYGVASVKRGPHIDRKIYVSSERDGLVACYDPLTGLNRAMIQTGAQPTALLLDRSNARLYVSNGGSDTVSVINTATDRILKTIMLRPPAVQGIPGVSPLGLCLSPDERSLYVALSDMNSIAVVDNINYKVKGYIPTGWLPTSLVCSPDGKKLLISSGKGIKSLNPNGKPVGKNGQYGPNIIEGTVSTISVPSQKSLDSLTRQVVANNRIEGFNEDGIRKQNPNPGIKYVIYVVKENRTYDQVFSDLPRGQRDPSLLVFGRDVTPNQHALVERFAQFDNFYVCAEVSADGWNWSTSGMANPYVSRNSMYNYSNRGRTYDFEGQNNGVPVDLRGLPDVARAPGGYIWEQAIKHNVSLRNYGFFTTFDDPDDKRFTMLQQGSDQVPTKKALMNSTCYEFRRYDLGYADSDAWVEYETPYSQQLKKYGKYGATSRFSAWKREFDQFVKEGEMPRLQLVRFGNDHTAGTRAGWASPKAMVADNDYAVGKLVEAVSNSPFWNQTLICILEDDAQAGYDHIDSHRSTAYVISPFVKRGVLDSRFYNTDSMLRTIGLMLGMKPMNTYDAVARPFQVFTATPENEEPYKAILPSKELISERNKSTAFGAQRSEALFPRLIADPGNDDEQTEIVWRAVTGKPVPKAFVGRKSADSD